MTEPSGQRAVIETVVCPFCCGEESMVWAEENGFRAVRCAGCGLVYVNPRPVRELISQAVETGVHSAETGGRTVIGRRQASKVRLYRRLLAGLFVDVWKGDTPISWLDVGAGFGEIVEAVASLAPAGSRVEGLEPMRPKAELARSRGLAVRESYLSEIGGTYGFLSLINVFSHIPDFREFLGETKRVLASGGEILIETGNIGDLDRRREVPVELDLPDHLVFAGERHLEGYLREAGFAVVEILRFRQDSAVGFARSLFKKLLGRRVALSFPYTSRYRKLLIRAHLKPSDLKNGTRTSK